LAFSVELGATVGLKDATHDGAQARLVSLSMLVGRAEEQLADRPEVAALVRERARRPAPRSASCAIWPAGSRRRC